MNVKKQLHNSVRYPTSLIIKGANQLGVEIAKSLLEQGGYVVIVDSESSKARKLLEPLAQYKLLTILDFDALPGLEDDLRRLDYVFYFEHKSGDLTERISTQEFLQFSNYLDAVLDLTAKFEAKFLLTTSISAHQALITSQQDRINFGEQSRERHTIYTELEIQRYAESLVSEYQEKVGINARIVRLAELLGHGAELTDDSALVKLIVDGLRGKNLVIPGDGLETNYYVHYLDAAYGILKAQFSVNTEGKIFTLANEDEISNLSIAYKLIEVLPGAQEIRFDQEDNILPPLTLYKPAPNLNTIGWKPRISFDRALTQTIEYIQKQLLDSKAKVEKVQVNNKNIGDKLRDFFFIADKEIAPETEEQKIEGALSKLIAERKLQENSRKGNIILANTRLRERVKSNRKGSIFTRIEDAFHDVLFRMGKKIDFLKNITVFDFVVSILVVVAFGVVYFLLISPLFSLSKNIFYLRSDFDRVAVNVNSFNFEQAVENSTRMNENLLEAQARVDDLQYLFEITGNQNLYLDLQRLLQSTVEYSGAYKSLFESLIPVEQYLEQVKPNISYRFAEDRILSVDSDDDYEGLLQRIETNKDVVALSTEHIQESATEIRLITENLPPRFQGILEDRIQHLDEQFLKYQSVLDFYQGMPEILGLHEPVNYLVVLQDSTRYSAAGGEISSLLYMQFDKGQLTEISISPVDAFPEKLSDYVLDPQVYREINLLSNKEVTDENIEFVDLAFIADQDVYLNTIGNLYQEFTGDNIDLAVSLNLNTLSEILQESGSIEYQQIEFDDDNLLTNINLLSKEQNDMAVKNQVITHIFANVVTRELNNIDKNILSLGTTMEHALVSSDSNIYASDVDIDNYLRQVSGNRENIQDQIRFGLNYEHEGFKQVEKYPITTAVIQVTVNKDLTTTKSIKLSAPGAENVQNLYICVPNGAKDFSFSDVNSSKVSSTFASDKICNIFLEDDNLSYIMNFNTVAFSNTESEQTSYEIELLKNPGIDSNYDLEIEFSPALEVTPLDSEYFEDEGKLIYSGLLDTNKIFKFEIEK